MCTKNAEKTFFQSFCKALHNLFIVGFFLGFDFCFVLQKTNVASSRYRKDLGGSLICAERGGVIVLDTPFHVVKDVKYKNGCSRDVDSW